MLRQIVCMKVTPKIEQIRFDEERKVIIREGVENEINEADKNALELALSLKERAGGTIIVVSMGPPLFEPFMKLAIAMGADDAVLLSDRRFAGADTYATSLVLSRAIKKLGPFDIVLCGEASSDGSTEQVPPSIAEWLGIPQITYVNSLRIDDGRAVARRSISGGYEVIEAPLPLLVSVELGCNTPRFPDFRRKRWAEREFKLKVWGLEDLGLDPGMVGLEGSYTTVKELRAMPASPRRGEVVKGDPRQVARRLAEIIKQSS